jgi:nucleoid-associated protein YgaU
MSNVLTDKKYREYRKTSRYSGVPYYYNINDDKYVYGVGKNLKDTTPFKTHKIREGESLDTLALYYYNNPTYFWIIADFNRINDPYETLEVGSKIKIPTFSSIEFED